MVLKRFSSNCTEDAGKSSYSRAGGRAAFKLIMADFSLKKAQALLEQIKEKGNNVDVIREVLLNEAPPFEPLRDTSVPSVFFIIGVNGVGKTTTVAKLAHMYAKQGKNVVVVGADTFRAAAQDQLSTLVNRMPVTYVGGERGSDSGSILYKALSENPQASVFLVDTAGRIHTSRALIDELSKLIKVGKKFSAEFPQEVLLVLDGTQGIQGYRQAMSFVQGTPITGLVLTKMDSTAKGGMIFSIWDELKILLNWFVSVSSLMTLISTAHKGLSMPSLGITAVVIMTEQSVETVMLRAVNLALDEIGEYWCSAVSWEPKGVDDRVTFLDKQIEKKLQSFCKNTAVTVSWVKNTV